MIASKYIKSSAFAIACALITLSAVAEPAKSSKQASVDREIQICVAEIGKHVKYSKASRIVHKVKEEQKNIAEQLFRISTTIYAGLDNVAIGEYHSLCVTRGPIELVSFRIDDSR